MQCTAYSYPNRDAAFRLTLLIATLLMPPFLQEGLATNVIRIADVPHVRQKPDFCGEACAEMALRKLGHTITQDDIFDAAGVDPVLGRGCRTPELAHALKAVGFETGRIWHPLTGDGRSDLQTVWTNLLFDLNIGVPSIVCMRTSARPSASEHFRLVLGYDADNDDILYHEPAEDGGAYRRMKRSELFSLWPLGETHNAFAVRLRLKPDRIRWVRPPSRFSNADYAQHIMTLRKQIPSPGFTTVLQKPFVVIGDEPREVVAERAVRTVQWATDQLKAAYFTNDPADIIDIWLFKDDTSYRKHARDIFHDEPTTPFGYSSQEHHALIMNIGTGGGTLVHEIVHPFMAANFPQCPAWFNEGLASLYEQSGTRRDRIAGLTNWRLKGLQTAIRGRTLPSFRELTATSTQEFYNEDRGSNYAQARYLCYYLQEHGLLRTFYHQFAANCRTDPTGYQTLQSVLGTDDMAGFQAKWEKAVLGLRFP